MDIDKLEGRELDAAVGHRPELGQEFSRVEADDPEQIHQVGINVVYDLRPGWGLIKQQIGRSGKDLHIAAVLRK